MTKHLGFMFIVSRPCGRVVATCWDEEGCERETAKWIRSMLRAGEGNTVKRVERFEGDPMPERICDGCKGKVCQEGGAQ
ncbi:MAG: hypothetical protein JSR74_12585 [Proteobacteria bacterium]|nr:hypothetical protein [Pseudomonadota bacterium]